MACASAYTSVRSRFEVKEFIFDRLFLSSHKFILSREKELIEEIEREKAIIVRERGVRYGYS